MKYLILIHLDEKELYALPEAEMSALNARHLEFNNRLRKSGNWIEAEALEPASTSKQVRVRRGKPAITDGPYAESKELVAGFYLIEARNIDEATRIASEIPSASIGTIEVWATRKLIVDGVARDA
ncbi:MAG: YciI family protein [Gemmatimonadota bacterium]|nr:YciI family protein [Gemmatimonadota bacterium]